MQFINDVVCAQAVAAPETQNKQNIYPGVYSDVWQFGQLMAKTLLGKQLNLKITRFEKDYMMIKSLCGEDLADLLAGCSDHIALRYNA